jgi:glycosyltransferase involved in cell wall biosynthesis
MLNPKISIIMPVFNRGDMIEKALLSILNQNYDNTEIIVIDGGSSDNTVEVIKRYEKHIAYWHSKADGCPALAQNIGIQKASGDLIALLMSDDFYEPGTFQKISQAYRENPDTDMITCAGRMIAFDEKKQQYKTIEEYNKEKNLRLSFYNTCYGPCGICFRFIKKSLHDRIGLYIPFDASNKSMITNDKEFMLRAVMNNVKSVFVQHLGYTHVAHQGSCSFGNSPATFLRHCIEHMDIAQQFLAKPNLSFKQKMFLTYWYNDQLVKLFLFKLSDKKFSQAFAVGIKGMKQHFIAWPAIFCITTVKAAFKRSLRLFRSLLSRNLTST